MSTNGKSLSQPESMTLYLARHGQSEWNNQSRVSGQLDPGLSPKGHQQSEAIAYCLRDENLAAIYASALKRTVATARPTADAKDLPIASMADLNEINLGILQGRFRDERDPEAQALWEKWRADMWSFQVPGGERFDQLMQRVNRAVDTILNSHRGRSVLLVGHRATNRVVLGRLMGWPCERWPELALRNKYLYRIRMGRETQIATFTLSGNKIGACHDGFIM